MSVVDLDARGGSLLTFHEWALEPTDNGLVRLPAIHFHAIKYGASSLYLWVGDNETRLDTLTCAMQTPYKSEPISTDILVQSHGGVGGANDGGSVFDTDSENQAMTSADLAIKLSKRLNKQAVVSFNVSSNLILQSASKQACDDYESFLLKAIVKSIFDEIKASPSKF